MQMKKMIRLTVLLLRTNYRYITTDPNHTMLQCKGGRRFGDDEEVETEVRKWLRQQSKDISAAGFEALLERWDKSIIVDGGYVEK
jgi:hypothetical protein